MAGKDSTPAAGTCAHTSLEKQAQQAEQDFVAAGGMECVRRMLSAAIDKWRAGETALASSLFETL